MSSNFWDDDAKPVAKPIAPKNAPTDTVQKNSFWDDDAKPAASGGFWDDDVAPKGQQMTMARGSETRQIDANPAAMHAAESEGFNTPEAQAHLSQYKPREPYSPLVSGARAVTSSALMGFDDEASGLVSGALSGLQGKDPIRSYKNSRDRVRAENEAAIRDNPGTSMLGSFAGSMAVPGFAALKAGRIGGAIANGALTAGVMGGVQGLGDTKDISDLPQAAADVGMGAGKGAVLGGIVGAGAHVATNLGDIKELPGYVKAMFHGARDMGKVTWPFGVKANTIALPIGALRGAAKHYKANGLKMAEEAVEKSAQHPPIKIGDPPANKLVGDAQAFGKKALEAGKNYAVNRAVRSGTDAAYNAATGTEEGLPDPIRDKSAEFIKDKMGLSDDQGKVMKRMIPSVYDLASRGGRAISKAHDNHVYKRPGIKLDDPTGEFVMDREVNHNGQKLRHEIYRDGSEIQHSLVDETGRRVAEIKGRIRNYKGDDGYAIGWSNSTTKGEGHGKKLYDLVLDTHDKVFSDDTLSPEGSRKVYEKHYAYSPGVHVDFDTPGTSDRFKVRFHDKNKFRDAKGIDPFPMDHDGNLKDINNLTLNSASTRTSRTPMTAEEREAHNAPARNNSEARQRIEQHARWVLDQGGDRDIAVNYVRSRGFQGRDAERLIDEIYARESPSTNAVSDSDIPFKNQDTPEDLAHYARMQKKYDAESQSQSGRPNPTGWDFDTDLKAEKTEQFDKLNQRSGPSSQAMRKAAERYLELTDNGASHEKAMEVVTRSHGVNPDSLDDFMEGWKDAPSPTELRNRTNPPDQMRDEHGHNNRLAMEMADQIFGNPEMQAAVRAEQRAALPKPERPMTNVTPGPSAQDAKDNKNANNRANKLLRETILEPYSDSGIYEDVRGTKDNLQFNLEQGSGGRIRIDRDRLDQTARDNLPLRTAHRDHPNLAPFDPEVMFRRPDGSKEYDAGRRNAIREETERLRLQKLGVRRMDFGDYVREQLGKGPDESKMQNVTPTESNLPSVRRPPVLRNKYDQEATDTALQMMRDNLFDGPDARSTLAMKDYIAEKDLGEIDWRQIDEAARGIESFRHQELQSHEREYRQERSRSAPTQAELREAAMRRMFDNVGHDPAESARERAQEQILAKFKAERNRSRMHAAGTEAPRGITKEEQADRLIAQRRAERERRIQEEEANFIPFGDPRRNKPPARPSLRAVPSEAEMKALLKKKKDKK